jgi:hypothetical protein
LALTVLSAGHADRIGGELSTTVTLKEQLVVFPAASLAVYVTTVVPLLKVLPGAFVEERMVPEQLSKKEGGVQLTTA